MKKTLDDFMAREFTIFISRAGFVTDRSGCCSNFYNLKVNNLYFQNINWRYKLTGNLNTPPDDTISRCEKKYLDYLPSSEMYNCFDFGLIKVQFKY